jgi:elongation factor G-like protein
MYFQYPLEILARKRDVRSQLEFAHEARRAFDDTDDAIFEPLDHGLAILAANEDALVMPTGVLRELYGDTVQVRRPAVRYLAGEPLQEPVMQVSVRVRREHAAVILEELRLRAVELAEECVRDRAFLVRGEAPMARLIGLPARLHAVTGGSAVHSIRLVRYAPVAPDAA